MSSRRRFFKKKAKAAPNVEPIIPKHLKDYLQIYTDGSCFKNGCKGAYGGIGVWFGKGHHQNCHEPITGKVTNNIAELYAAIHALKITPKEHKKIQILSDSKYLIDGMNIWIKNWVPNGWKTYENNPVKNVEHFKELYRLCKKRERVVFNYVPGHVGVIGNEEADKLAKGIVQKTNLFISESTNKSMIRLVKEHY